MLASIPEVFPFLRREKKQAVISSRQHQEPSFRPPPVKVSLDKPAYRPGDTLFATIEVSCDKKSPFLSSSEVLLLENLIVEIKGLEKLDLQWLLTAELPRGSKERQGERTILESSATAVVSDVLFELGAKRTYLVRASLPKVLPPTYKGTVVRYLYYFVVGLQWSIAVIQNGHNGPLSPKTSLPPTETKTLLNIWTMPIKSGLALKEPQGKDYWGIVPQVAVCVEIYWKEKNDENDWARASDVLSEIEDEDGSPSTESLLHSPEKGNIMMSFEREMRLQSPTTTPRVVSRESFSFHPGVVPSFGSLKKPAFLTAAVADSNGGFPTRDGYGAEKRASLRGKGLSEVWLDGNDSLPDGVAHENFANGNHEHEFVTALPRSPSGTYAQGRSYNIIFDDQVLAHFSPKNPDSTYYFGDVIGGVLSFFHDEGPRRCLEISAVLETREVLNPVLIHPSRKNSPVITKVQAEHTEAVADMVQTHFVFSIPFDGPPSFTSPHLSLQWLLKFEFVTTTRNIDWSQYEHPLLVEERERGEWSIPILVHAPLPRTQKAKVRRERSSSPTRIDSWSDSASFGGRIPPLLLPPSSDKYHGSRGQLDQAFSTQDSPLGSQCKPILQDLQLERQ